MKTVLLIVSGIYTSAATVASAIKLAKETNCRLDATFLDTDREGVPGQYFFPNDLALTVNSLTGNTIAEEDKVLVDASVAAFRKECDALKVPYSVNPNRQMTGEELVRQAAYADLIIADCRAPFSEQLIANSLNLKFCPVLLLSPELRSPDRIIVAYDYSPASMFGIKMFGYLFPEWKAKPVDLVHVVDEREEGARRPEEAARYLSAHFDTVTPELLLGKVQDSLVDFISPSEANSLVVIGCDSRSGVGRFFHSSVAQAIISRTSASVFVTHI